MSTTQTPLTADIEVFPHLASRFDLGEPQSKTGMYLNLSNSEASISVLFEEEEAIRFGKLLASAYRVDDSIRWRQKASFKVSPGTASSMLVVAGPVKCEISAHDIPHRGTFGIRVRFACTSMSFTYDRRHIAEVLHFLPASWNIDVPQSEQESGEK